jgi:hypothetical protein
MAEYNGWRNYETWNVSLWLGNDEPMYRDMQRLARSAGTLDRLARRIARYVKAEWVRGSFGDLRKRDGDSLAAVDWLAIADGFAEDMTA